MEQNSTRYGSFELQGLRYYVGDVVVVRSSTDGSTPPYIGKLVEVAVDGNGYVALKMRWYYRPEDTDSGRMFHHGAQELFSSNHYDTVYVESVVTKGLVLSLDHFHDMVQRHAAGELTESDAGTKLELIFFCRQHYNIESLTYAPELDTYCSCKRPCNPDNIMIGCDSCDNWFHIECVSVDPKIASSLDSFVCESCKAAQ